MEKKIVWTCNDCGKKYGNKSVGIATWHEDVCDICGKKTIVTEPRDWGGLKQSKGITRRVHIEKNVSYGIFKDFDRIKIVREMIVKKHEKEIKDGIDVTGKLKCPYCDGYISYGMANSVNGHIHAFCENDCVRWME